MPKKKYWILHAYILFFIIYSSAHACQSDTDCVKWVETNCACGVRATCIGVTEQQQTGHCQCYGAQGNCKADTLKDVNNSSTVYRGRVVPRATPARRGVRRGQVDIDVHR